MLTTLVIGTRFTKRTGRFLYAPRGYHGWGTQTPLPQEAIWFFTGTRDGNALAAQCAAIGTPTVISVASEYGATQARRHSPLSAIVSGRIGETARANLLRQSKALAIVDATHPFATAISTQLIGLCAGLNLPYLRFNRPQAPLPDDILSVSSIEAAANLARDKGRRIFISTGVKDLNAFTKLTDREWFARITPGVDSLERALAAGIPAARICAMQGPFSQRANEALWKDWEIDCVVTKDSGDTGGLPAKIVAAHTLGIPLIVVQRPEISYPSYTEQTEGVTEWIKTLQVKS
jgi:precorrin-3B C17-methyltransferase